MKIQLTSKNKINNPVDNPVNTYSFEGEFNIDMFEDSDSEQFQYLKSQRANFQNLSEVINNLELSFEYIWMGTFENYDGHRATNFIIRTNLNNNKQIFWHKYATLSPGSGQNWIYEIDNDQRRKCQLTKWLAVI